MNHIGELLVEHGLVSNQQLSQIDPSGDLDNEALLLELDRNQVIDRVAAYKAMAEEFGVDFIDLANTEVDLSLLNLFPQKLIYREILFPVRKEGETLIVASADPSDHDPLDEASAETVMMVAP